MFDIYIRKVLNQIHPDLRIGSDALQQLNSVIVSLGRKLASTTGELTRDAKKATISSSEVLMACKVLLRGELITHANSDGNKAVNKYASSETGAATTRSGLIFPPSRAIKLLKESSCIKRHSAKAGVCLAAVLEYMSAEVLELAGDSARNNKQKTIGVRNLFLAINGDPELKETLASMDIKLVGGGVEQHIEEKLLPGKKKPLAKKIEGEKPHRFRPGTVALRDIKKQQKNSNCLIFPRASFQRSIRNLVKNFTYNEVRFSPEALILLQYAFEDHLTDILRDANSICVHAGRQQLMPKDLKLALKVRKDRC